MKKTFEQVLSTNTPLIMGIINCSPDSFYNNSVAENVDIGLQMAHSFIYNGAEILDIGGQSTRPDFTEISIEEEIRRVIPLITAIRKEFPDIIISIDSYRTQVITEAISAGADWINDIGGGDFDSSVLSMVAGFKKPYICMHSSSLLKHLHQSTSTENIVADIAQYFILKQKHLNAFGIKNIIFDPGIGFGKTIEQNFTILKNIEHLTSLRMPILIGLSRKSFMYKTLHKKPDEIIHATAALHFWSILNGVKILRVHDVEETKDIIQLAKNFNFP